MHNPLHHAKPIPLPPVPDSLLGYSDLFRSYCIKVQQVIVRRSKGVDLAFTDGLGSLSYLFLLADSSGIGYLSFMTCCWYWHSRDEYFTRSRIFEHLNYSQPHIESYLSQAFKQGHLSKMNRMRYQMTREGEIWLKVQARQLYRDILALNDIL